MKMGGWLESGKEGGEGIGGGGEGVQKLKKETDAP